MGWGSINVRFGRRIDVDDPDGRRSRIIGCESRTGAAGEFAAPGGPHGEPCEYLVSKILPLPTESYSLDLFDLVADTLTGEHRDAAQWASGAAAKNISPLFW